MSCFAPRPPSKRTTQSSRVSSSRFSVGRASPGFNFHVLVTSFRQACGDQRIGHCPHLSLINVAVKRVPAVDAHRRRLCRGHLQRRRRKCHRGRRSSRSRNSGSSGERLQEWSRREAVLVVEHALRVVAVRVPDQRRCGHVRGQDNSAVGAKRFDCGVCAVEPRTL